MIVQFRQWGVACLLTLAGATFAQTDRLLQGGQMSFRVDYAELYVQRNCRGQTPTFYSQTPARVVFDSSTLNFSVPLNRIVNAFDSEAILSYTFEQIDDDSYVWTMEPISQPICTTFNANGQEFRFRIDSVYSQLFATPVEIPYQPDPLETLQCVSVRLDFASVFTLTGFRGYFVDENCTPIEPGCIYVVWFDAVGYGGGRPADIDCDDCVDDADLLYVMFATGSNDPSADLDGDGFVGEADLLIAIMNFRAGCDD